jgi:hypothetical protein
MPATGRGSVTKTPGLGRGPGVMATAVAIPSGILVSLRAAVGAAHFSTPIQVAETATGSADLIAATSNQSSVSHEVGTSPAETNIDVDAVNPRRWDLRGCFEVALRGGGEPPNFHPVVSQNSIAVSVHHSAKSGELSADGRGERMRRCLSSRSRDAYLVHNLSPRPAKMPKRGKDERAGNQVDSSA